jgi:hypothetical protein
VKKILALIFLFPTLIFAGSTNTYTQPSQYSPFYNLGSVSVALAAVSPTVRSASVDLSAAAGAFVCVSGTSSLLNVEYSLDGGTWRLGEIVNTPDCVWVAKKARYMRFQSASTNLTYTTMSASYDLGVNGATLVGALGIAGSLTWSAATQNGIAGSLTYAASAIGSPSASAAVTVALSTDGQATYVICSAKGSIEFTNWTASPVSMCVEADANTVTAVYNLYIQATSSVVLTKEDYFIGGEWVKYFGAGTGNVSIKNRY